MSAAPKLNPELTTEAPARPKVLRRPPHLMPAHPKPAAAKPAPMMAAPTLVLTEAALEEPDADDAPATAAAPTWHDDRRFTFILLAIVILINVAVVAWLSMIPQQKEIAASAPVSIYDPSPLRQENLPLFDTPTPQ